MQKQKLIVILGPTATGKSALAIHLAKKFNGEVVSADSRQVYRGLDLGTGKVTKKEMAGVPHHLLDVTDPKKQFSVAEYAVLADKAIEDILSHGKLPIICGGTGLYIDTVVNGVVLPEVPANPALREKLARKSASALFRALQKLDPARAKTIDRNNPVRLIRAIEIATALGKVPKLKHRAVPYEILKIGLDMPDDVLKERIGVRLAARQKMGMLREAERLHAAGLSWRRMRELGLEYRHMANFLTKKSSLKEFKVELSMNIWHYAKRQRTWFRRDKSILWLDPTKKNISVLADSAVKKFLR